MEKQKKNSKVTIITLVMLTAVFLAIAAIAGYGYAKYVSNFGGDMQAQVAKWSFKVNGSEGNAKTFNLINTINKNDSVTEGTVAPGTSGYFDLELDGSGTETAINYVINTSLQNKPANMHFYLDENYTVELAVENNEIVINDFIPLSEVDTVKKVRIYWNWPLETGNTEEEIYKNDLIDSESIGKEMIADITVTGIQVLPESKEASYKVYYYLENANDNGFGLYSTQTYSKNTDSELTLSNVAIDIPDAKYAYGCSTPNGEHVSNVKIANDGSTNVYLYYLRDRYSLTTIAGENIGEVKSTGLSTGTSNSISSEDGENKFEQSKTKMVTKYKWGETVSIEAVEASVEGYTNKFKSWNISDSQTSVDLGTLYNSGKSETTITMPKQEVTLTATAEKTANTYTVVFNENTGTGKMTNQQFTYDVEQSITPNSFTKTGYTFESWNTQEDGTGTKYEDKQVVKNLTGTPNGTVNLYAQWKPNEYLVIFNSNGGNGTMEPQTLKYDDVQELLENKFTKDGYTFTGWNLAQDGTDTNYANKEQVLNLTSENGGRIELYAQWSANSYTVEFNANGGTGTMSSQVFTYDVSKALRANGFSKLGYSFAGWSVDKDYVVKGEDSKLYKDKEEVSNLVKTPNGTITLYAIWVKNTYTVIYNSNAPTETITGTMENSKFEYDTTGKLEENKYTRIGYTFKNWNLAQDGTGESYSNSSEVKNLTKTQNGIVTLYAIWEPNTYRINFNSNTGVGSMDTQVCTYDVSANLSTNKFTKTGYTFAGWCTVANPVGSAKFYNNNQEIINLISEKNGQITLYAQWTANTNTPYEVAHFVMNTKGIYMLSQTETLTGTTDSAIDLTKLIKTSSAYNIPNGIYYKETKVDGKLASNATVKPDGTLQIGIYYARSYGYLTTAKSSYISSITEISNKKFYYGESIPEITATVEFAQGYLTNFDKWESDNKTAITDITENPIQNKTWPAMEEGSKVTLTAKATRTVSDKTPYKVNYYLENANDSEYTLYSTKTFAGTTNASITVSDVDISLANCTIAKTDITSGTVIKPDGTTEVNVYYNRNKFVLTISGGDNIIETKLSTENEETVDNSEPIMITKDVKWGETAKINATVESLPGYTYEYIGWEITGTSDLGTEFDYAKKNTEIVMPSEDLTLTAKASKTANKYTIVFDANSGNGTMANQIFTYDVAQNLSKNTFTKTGYVFKGWATEDSLNGSNEDENVKSSSETESGSSDDVNLNGSSQEKNSKNSQVVYLDQAEILNNYIICNLGR